MFKLIRNISHFLASMFQQKESADSFVVADRPHRQARLSDEGSGILKEPIDITNWRQNIQTRSAHRNKILVSLGSLSRLVSGFHALDAKYDAENSDLAVTVATSFTGDDLEELIQIKEHRARWSRLSEGDDPVFDTYVPRPPLLISRPLEARSNVGGNGNRPSLCVDRLTGDPTLIRALSRLADEIVSDFREFLATRPNLMVLRGIGGGSLPALDLLIDFLESRLRVASRYQMNVLPCLEEHLAVPNARGVLQKMLNEDTPEGTIRLFAMNNQIGEHPTDLALCGGGLTIVSSVRGGPDATTIFETIKSHGDLGILIPKVVPVRMNLIGERRLERAASADWRGRVLPETEAGGQYLNLITDEIASLVAEDPEAYHLVSVFGPFTKQDVIDLRDNGRSLLAAGQVQILVNPFNPPVTGDGQDALLYICDCRVYRKDRVPSLLADFLYYRGYSANGQGVDRQDLIRMLGHSREWEEAEEVAKRVERLAQTYRP